jgi:F-type H+-transporting ATPase subunit a
VADPMHQFEVHKVVDLPDFTLPGVGVIDMAITNSTIAMFAAAGLIIAFFSFVTARPQVVPGRLQVIGEAAFGFIDDLTEQINGPEGRKFFPFVMTLFLFIFAMNLIGMLPFMSSPTASIMVTGALALVSFLVIHVSGLKDHGPGGYLKTFIPHIHLEGGAVMKVMGAGITAGMAVLEYATAFIRAGVLAVRLFANMLAGHTVLFMILFFIKLVADPHYQIPIAQDWMWWAVTPFSVLLVTALSLLELFIAGLQAFIFTFLTSVFIGLAKHPPH